MNPMNAAPQPVAAVLERVLGDRQCHERGIIEVPQGRNPQYASPKGTPRLRIYVATSRGACLLEDDRASLDPERANRLEIVRAEYRDDSQDTPVAGSGTSSLNVFCRSECKGEMLYLLAQDNRHRSRCDYVAFLDDDIRVRASDLLAASEQAALRGCCVFQVQLCRDSHAVWPILQEDEQLEAWSGINFVEIMAPVISQDELDLGLLDVLRPFKSGFGWDFYLLPCLSGLFPDFRMGVYRGASMAHVRPINTGNDTIFSNGLTALQEEELLRSALLMTLLRPAAITSRQAFLTQLQEVLAQRWEALQGLAGGLHTITERYWYGRKLEAHGRELEALLQQEREGNEALAEQNRQLRQANDDLAEQVVQQRQERQELDLMIAELREEIAHHVAYVQEIKASHTWLLGRLCLLPVVIFRRLRRVLLPTHGGD